MAMPGKSIKNPLPFRVEKKHDYYSENKLCPVKQKRAM
jgi:hypothetical protein